AADKPSNGPGVAWVNYRHWIRSGGDHVSSVALPRWPEALERPKEGFGQLKYDEERELLVCHGALSPQYRDELLAEGGEPEFCRAIERLYEQSHVAPITDVYGYDRGREGQGRHEVRDLMLSATVRLHEGPGEFILAMNDGTEEVRCVF